PSDHLGICRIPHPRRAVLASRDHKSAVGRKGGKSDPARMSQRLPGSLATERIPNLRSFITAGRDDPTSIAAEFRGVDPRPVRPDLDELRAILEHIGQAQTMNFCA